MGAAAAPSNGHSLLDPSPASCSIRQSMDSLNQVVIMAGGITL